MIGDVAGERHLMRHDDHSDAVVGELPHDRQDLADELGIERCAAALA